MRRGEGRLDPMIPIMLGGGRRWADIVVIVLL